MSVFPFPYQSGYVADGHGYYVDASPHARDIAQWFDNHNGAGGLGHVAYVQSVNGDGTITVYEYNCCGVLPRSG